MMGSNEEMVRNKYFAKFSTKNKSDNRFSM